MIFKTFALLIPLFAFFVSTISAELFDPTALYLTWQHNPEKTMTICWLTSEDRPEDLVEYHPENCSTWLQTSGKHSLLKIHPNYLVHIVELDNLKSNTGYVFRLGKDSVEFKFRTMPSDTESPIRFVVGGDMYLSTLDILEETHRQAASTDPMFALLGGDLAYAYSNSDKNEEIKEEQRWIDWLIAWKTCMVTSEGYLIPMLPILGNHDVGGGYNQPPEKAHVFYTLFPMPGRQGYNVVDFNDYMSIFLLDSGHTHDVSGKQTKWLKHSLKTRKMVPHKFALYHVPAYPSIRDMNNKRSQSIRKSWVPLFEKYHVNAAFENHDHGYKRTFPIYNGEIDDVNGILYLGDGGWGVKKTPNPKAKEKPWYLAKTVPARHFILVTIQRETRQYSAIDHAGKIIDSYNQ